MAVCVVEGPELVITAANPTAIDQWGRSHASQVLGLTVAAALPEATGQGFEERLREVMATARPFVGTELPVLLRNRDSGEVEQRYVNRIYQPYLDPDGRVIGVLAIGTDVTETVRARQRAAALAELQRDEFLATLAHELRNPMAAISMALSLLDQVATDPPRADKYRATAQRQMTRLVRIVDDLLDVARITRGRFELHPEPTDLAALVHEAVAASRPLVELHRHALAVEIAPGAYPVVADPTRIVQVIENLLSNAAKYTDPGGTIAIALARDPSGAAAVLRVADTGRGIPPEMLGRVFEMFAQVSPTIDRQAGGLGLGLALVKRVVEMHGGSVAAASEGPGRGSVFTVALPLVAETAETAAAAATVAAAGRARDTARQAVLAPMPAARRLRVLLVEDSPDLRETVADLLRTMGHDVVAAADGEDGVARAAAADPDLALVDIGLPRIDGYEAARRIRALPGGGRIQLVALTGYGGADITARALAAGFDQHLTKPIEIDALDDLLARLAARGSQ
jgi:signal transduction histidine kinase/ActR/RegA family two-component response regulator